MTDWIMAHLPGTLAAGLVLLLTLIQVMPIRIDPWSAIARAIGRAINKDINHKVEEIGESLSKHVAIDDERFIKQTRMRILRFNDELLQGKRHTKEHFDEVLDDITTYNNYCNTHENYKNSKAEMAIRHIETTYQDCIVNRSFLQGGEGNEKLETVFEGGGCPGCPHHRPDGGGDNWDHGCAG